VIIIDPEDGYYEVGMEEREEPRYYEVGGVRYPSVTTVLGVVRNPFLQKWRGHVGNTAADTVTTQAATYGQGIHDLTAIMDMMRAGVREAGGAPDGMETQLEAYHRWRLTFVEEILEVEIMVVSRHHGYAGRLDRVFRLKGDTLPSVWDIKTGTTRNISRAQTAAYASAYTEMTGLPIGRRGLLSVSRRTGRVGMVEHSDPGDIGGFLALLGAYRWLVAIGEA
jgi:hypothetical protein